MNTLLRQFIRYINRYCSLPLANEFVATDNQAQIAIHEVPFEYLLYPSETHHLFMLQQSQSADNEEY